jgi:putative tryptophan/tyrosine transport system substrate-binding protein
MSSPEPRGVALRRRDFITLFGVTAITWPLTARSQQSPSALPVVGVLGTGSQSDAFRVAPFRQGLKETGYVEGHNVAIEYRWAEGHYDRVPALAADLVHRGVRVIAAIGGLTTAVAAKSSTATIPVVFEIGGDPVGLGLVSSLNRPGGNITGVSLLIGTLSAKRFQIMQETVPKAALIGFLMNPANADAQAQTKDVLAAAESVGQKLAVIQARTDRELEAAFATLTEKRADALLVMADPFFVTRRDKLVELAAGHKVPTMYPLREFVAAGGLMSYGASIAEAHRTVGMYVGRILSGEKPSDLPVQQATKVELIINLKTAKALGITVPNTLIGRADEVIE